MSSLEDRRSQRASRIAGASSATRTLITPGLATRAAAGGGVEEDDRKAPGALVPASEGEPEVIVPVFGGRGGRLNRPERAIWTVGEIAYAAVIPEARSASLRGVSFTPNSAAASGASARLSEDRISAAAGEMWGFLSVSLRRDSLRTRPMNSAAVTVSGPWRANVPLPGGAGSPAPASTAARSSTYTGARR